MENVATEAAPAAAVEQSANTAQSINDDYLVDIDVNGKKEKAKLSELKAGYQQTVAAQRKFREAAEARKEADAKKKEVESFNKAVEDGDLEALFKFVSKDKFRKLAEKHLSDIIEFEELPPELQELQLTKRELEQLRKEKEASTKSKEEAEKEAKYKVEFDKALASVDEGFSGVFRKLGITPDPAVIDGMAEECINHLKVTGTQLHPEAAYHRAMRRFRQRLGIYLEKMPIDKAKELFPDGYFDKVRKYYVDEVKSQYPVSRPIKRDGDTTSSQSSKKKLNTESFFEKLERGYK